MALTFFLSIFSAAWYPPSYVKKPFYMGETRLEVIKYSTNDDSANICVREKGTNLIINNENCDISEIDVDTLYQGRMKK